MTKMTNKIRSQPQPSILARILLLLIRGYQYCFSSFMGRSCRFHPTCSSYSKTAVTRYGAFKGVVLTVIRLCRCHPWNRGGYDPVPEKHRFFSNKTLWDGVHKCDKQSHKQEASKLRFKE